MEKDFILVGTVVEFKNDIEEVKSSFGLPITDDEYSKFDTNTYKTLLQNFPIGICHINGKKISMEAIIIKFESEQLRSKWKIENRPFIYIEGTLSYRGQNKYYVRYFKYGTFNIKLSYLKYILQFIYTKLNIKSQKFTNWFTKFNVDDINLSK
jgi:hypothetical protein